MAKQERIFAAGCSEQIARALDILKTGGVVVIPTDTLYGLAAGVFDDRALQKVFTIKGRPSDLALPVLVSGWDMVEQVATNFPSGAQVLAEKFWPGSLTLVLPKAPELSPLITGGRDTVAVRSPDHHVPQRLIAGLGRPITGTSANRSGTPDLQSLDAVLSELEDSVDYIISCGPAPRGTASTIVDLTGDEPKLLREGVIPFNEVLSYRK